VLLNQQRPGTATFWCRRAEVPEVPRQDESSAACGHRHNHRVSQVNADTNEAFQKVERVNVLGIRRRAQGVYSFEEGSSDSERRRRMAAGA
jgi:hypothetical protein